MKIINGFEEYAIKENGEVVSLPRKDGRGFNREAKLLKPIYREDWYPIVRLTKNKKRFNRSVHRLLAEAFIPNPNNLPQVNHKNGVKSDFRLENLEWCTPLGNTRHALITGLRPNNTGDNCIARKLSSMDVRVIKSALLSGFSQSCIARYFKVHYSTIYLIATGRNWKSVTP